MRRFLFLFLLLSSSLKAVDGWIEAGGGYFRADAERLRDTFGSFWIDARFSGSLAVGKGLYLFADLDWIQKKRHSAEISLLPLSLGLKWMLPLLPRLDFYPALAAKYFWAWGKKCTDEGLSRDRPHTLGGMAGIGLLLQPSSHLFFDCNVTYSAARFPHSLFQEGKALWAGGFTAAAEAGWKF